MKPKLAAMSALVAYVSERALRLVTILFAASVALALGLTWVLSYFLSDWFWLLAVPTIFAVIVFIAIRFSIKRIISLIHRHPFTTKQREQLESFTHKARELAEVRAMPLPLFALQTLRDLLRNRDATTVRKIVENSASLKDDFALLEKQFGER